MITGILLLHNNYLNNFILSKYLEIMELSSSVLNTLKSLASDDQQTQKAAVFTDEEYSELVGLYFDSFLIDSKKLATFELNLNSKKIGNKHVNFFQFLIILLNL
jgi:hypothetical protein